MPPVDHIKKFVADLRADPELAPLADEMERALQAVDIAADGNDSLAENFAGIEWLISQPKTVQQKYDAVIKLVSLKGQGHVQITSLRAFAGWGN
jgi:hypothetical protein